MTVGYHESYKSFNGPTIEDVTEQACKELNIGDDNEQAGIAR
jgi:hypothetical protein